ncbi:dual adapter for phosphotyrosine and 3-phosphotyrosine and 3-phosphoinositide isoform X2 [Hydra vulgaris]|uniref:dual adapter for phosphotyrosine and 3-phosphotyrosine and 3-phosphoinositide isoform X2 n=1 Tax=Hydra vulgaris TaxID=6087 RepID=UPI0032EA4C0D
MEDRVEDLGWFHSNLDRHQAEALLLHNGQDGSYLLRICTNNENSYVLSCRCANSVKHFQISYDGKYYRFGMAIFETFSELVKHFENQPLLGGESAGQQFLKMKKTPGKETTSKCLAQEFQGPSTGVLTLLKYPYPRRVNEPSSYETVVIHAETGYNSSIKKFRPQSINSKEGYLTKQGLKIKSWRTRWFVLFRNELLYYKTKNEKQPLGIINLKICLSVTKDEEIGKNYAFRIHMPYRVYYVYAVSDIERQEWIDILCWKLIQNGIE